MARRLLDRVGKKVLLTQAGEQFFQRVDKILGEMILARAELDQLGEWGRGRLRVGASAAACQYILPPVLREFQKEFPSADWALNQGTPKRSWNRYEPTRSMWLTLEPEREPDFSFSPLFTDELMFLVNPKHPWAESRRAVRMEISREQYILYLRNSRTFEQIENYFRTGKMAIKSVIDMGSMSAIKELVKLGLGVTILAPWVAQNELTKKSLVALPLGRRKLKRQWGVLYWKERPMGWAEWLLHQAIELARDNSPLAMAFARTYKRRVPMKAYRLNRLFNAKSGRCFDVAVDHGFLAVSAAS